MDNISVRLFVGSPITARMKLLLTENDNWRCDNVDQTTGLSMVHFQNKEYVGMFMKQLDPVVANFTKLEADIKEKLGYYCPDINTEILSMKIFSQVFLA
jgi:hypothetical protein